MKHSPGRWRCEPRGHSILVTGGDTGEHLATVFLIGWPEEGVMEANAEIMAASPELLDMLRGVHGTCSCPHGIGDPRVSAHSDRCKAATALLKRLAGL